MSSARIDQLLGTSTRRPPRALAEGALFGDAEAYRAFLERTVEDPEAFWLETARGLRWGEPPQAARGPGGWFAGGRLNGAACCLDPLAAGKGDDEPIIAELRGTDGRPVEITRGELRERIGALASAMGEWGLPPGTRLLVALPAGARMVAAVLAGLRLGLVCVPIDPSFAPERVARRLSGAGCEAALVDGEAAGMLGQAPDRLLVVGEDDASSTPALPEAVAYPSAHPAFLLANSAGRLYTLPTAGFLARGVSAYRHLLDGRGGEDRLWSLAPAHHASSLATVFGGLASGGRVGFLPREIARTPEAFLAAVEAVEPRVLFTDVKTIREPLRAADEQGARPRGRGPALLAIEGETLDPGGWAALENGLFDGETHITGLLARPESGGFVAGPHPGATPVRRSSVALSSPGVQLEVVDVKGQPLEPGQGGLLALGRKIPGLPLELEEHPTPIVLEVKARKDRTGYIFAMGEVKLDRSVREATTIPELEAVIASCRGVDQVAVIQFGAPGARTRRAYVKPLGEAGGIAEEIGKRIAERCGEESVPEQIKLVEELPRSNTGKLLRSVLRRLARGEPLGPDDLADLADPDVVAKLT